MNATVLAPVHDAAAVGQLLRLSCTADQLAGFGPPPEPAEGFVTFFDPGWSILQLRAAVKERRIIYPISWYDDQPFAIVEDRPRYRQVRMVPIHGSIRKTYAEQVALLPDGEEVPPARVVVTALVIHFLATGQRLLQDVCVRCADQYLPGYRVDVGGFDAVGLDIRGDWEGRRIDNAGLASEVSVTLSS